MVETNTEAHARASWFCSRYNKMSVCSSKILRTKALLSIPRTGTERRMTAAVNYTKQQKVLEMVSVDKKNRQPWYFPMTALRLSKGLAEHEYHRKRETANL